MGVGPVGEALAAAARQRLALCSLLAAVMVCAVAAPARADDGGREKNCYCLFLDAGHKREYCDRYQANDDQICYQRCRCDRPYDRAEQRAMNKQEYASAWQDVGNCCGDCLRPLAGIATLVLFILTNPRF